MLLSISPALPDDLSAAVAGGLADLPPVDEIHPAWFVSYRPTGQTYAEFVASLAPMPEPRRSSNDLASLDIEPTAAPIVGESEPNDTRGTADPLDLGFDVGESWTIQVNGSNTGGDVDYFRVELNAGDILGVNVFPTFAAEATRVSIEDSAGVELAGSQADMNSLTGVLSTPLPRGGRSVSIVAAADGSHYVSVSGGSFGYLLELRVFRPSLERQPESAHQILFVDFDGATIDASIFPGGSGMRSLSPLSSFLSDWGLSSSDESDVVDAILATVEENLSTFIRGAGNNGDFDASGVPGDFDITILNSRDHPDPFGSPNVSRVIVGGTVAQLGIPTIGIADSIDVGNFITNETAVVLLDALSDPSETESDSLNNVPLGPSASIIDLIGVAVGNIAAHEAGHYFGNWHTDNQNATPTIMDQGGNLANTIGLGPDGIFGTADDVNVQFGTDAYNPNEPFSGMQDTLNKIAFGLSTGTVTTGGTAGRVYVVERTNGTQPTTGGEIGIYDFNGNRVGSVRSDVFSQGTISDVEVHPTTGNIYVDIDQNGTTSGLIVGFNPAGKQVQAINVTTDLPGSSITPYGFDIGPDGHFWVTQPNGNLILRYNASGSLVDSFDANPGNGIADVAVRPDGNNFWFSRNPSQMLNLRSDGNLWLADSANNRSILVDPSVPEILDERAGSAPTDPEEAPDGSLFVTNFGTKTLEKFNAGGTSLFDVNTAGTPIGLALAPADELPVISVAATDPDASESGPDPAVFTLTRSGSTSSALVVFYSLTGTAGNGTDYTSLSGSVTFGVGSSTATVTVNPIGDGVPEDTESVVLTLNPTTDYLVGGASSDTVTITDSVASLPDLTAAAPAGWDGPIVVSVATGTNTDAAMITDADTIYVDWSLQNQGDAATAVQFHSRLLLDGNQVGNWLTDPPVDPGSFSWVQDFNLGTLSPGTHTLTLEIDHLNEQAESDETNNSFSRQFTVVAAGLPDITPAAPAGWDGPIVVSVVTGTNTDASVITSADTIYVDWSIQNAGIVDTDVRFDTRLLRDGNQVGAWFTPPPLLVNQFGVVQDFSLGQLAPGVYTLALETDYLDDLVESDETNNVFMKQFTVIDANSASLGDLVWHDLDGDGIQDAGEPGVDGVTVELHNAGGLVDSTTTAGGGLYSFTDLPADDYFLQFVAPPGFIFTPQDQGVDDALDSDADATGGTALFTLAAGGDDPTRDAGLVAVSPPTVTEVLVRGSGWTQAFLDSLDSSGLGTGGYSIPTGSSAQLDPLPWFNLDSVAIRFSEDVDVQQDDLAIRGVNVASYSFSGFSYDPATFTATWTLSSVVATDKLLLDLDGSSATGVTDVDDGLLLDGEFTNEVDTLPASGDGTAGGDFAFRVNVLPGDVNQSGAVNLGDVLPVFFAVPSSIGDAGYSVLFDVNGSGTINLGDVLPIFFAVPDSLPVGEPTASSTAVRFETLGATGPGGTNDELRMTKEARNPKYEGYSSFVLRHSFQRQRGLP